MQQSPEGQGCDPDWNQEARASRVRARWEMATVNQGTSKLISELQKPPEPVPGTGRSGLPGKSSTEQPAQPRFLQGILQGIQRAGRRGALGSGRFFLEESSN